MNSCSSRVLLSRLAGRAPDRVDLITQLAEFGELEVIPYIFSLVVDGPGAVAAAAARAVAALMSDISSRQLLQLDLAIRQHSGAWWSSAAGFDYHLLSPAKVKRLIGHGEASTMLLGIASFTANGYVREAAIKKLAEIRTGRELPFLVVRINDWVPQVQSAAQDALEERLTRSTRDSLWRASPC